MKTKNWRPWTDEEVKLMSHLRDKEHLTRRQIALRLNRPMGSIIAKIDRERWGYNNPDDKLGFRYTYIKPFAPPPEALEDLNLRYAASFRRSLTGSICGDPPPGFSALDRRELA